MDMNKVEENIDKIIDTKLHSKQLELGQDCFIPCKKAIINSNQFIGYIYEDNSLDDVSIDIKDLNLSNLPRLKSLIRLILQIKDITQKQLGFIKNPFSHVYLNKEHKKQVQILNVEFLQKVENIEDTIRWTCEYIYDVISFDSSIELDLSNCSTDLDNLLIKLQNLSKEMTKHCSIHKMYYKNSNVFCPKCIDKSQLKGIKLLYIASSIITNQEPFNIGGESTIYPYKDNLVAKVFKEEQINYDFKNLVILKLLTKSDVLKQINKQKHKYKYIIIKKLLVDNKSNNIFGYIMEKVDGNPISILKDKVQVEKLGITMQDVFEILITIGEGIEALHANNIYIGDFNSRNILFDSQKNVYFLDFDGMGIDDIKPMFFTDGYIDPLSKKNQNITMDDDWYSFAIQAFYYLTFTHPFNGIYSIEEDGREVMLDIPDKMERRISLLGDHGMKAPAIALSWNWMNEELKKAFLDIFEGNSRKSIVPYLICQYKNIYNDDPYNPANKNIRVNFKFIAIQVNLFSGDVIRIINHYCAICKKEDLYYVSILLNKKDQYDINLPKCIKINKVLLSEDEKLAFMIFEKEIIVVDLETNTQIYKEEVSDSKNVVVNGNTLYFTGTLEEEHVIFQIDFSIKEEVKKETIAFLPNLETKSFLAKFNSKFIIVKSNQNIDEVYCNSQRFLTINKSIETEYNIIYDNTTKSWLIVNSQRDVTVIKADGQYISFDIQESIDINIQTVNFNKGNMYIPSKECLYIINVNDQLRPKKMECHKIMTPDSQLYNFNTKGFCVITNNMLYEIRRG